MHAQLVGLTADRIMDTLVGVTGFAAGMTQTQVDDLAHAAAVACRNDAAFMAKLRGLVDTPASQSSEPQAIDLATILKIIAAIKTIIDLIGQLKGGGGGLPSLPGLPGFNPNQANRCI
jgi:hypothetical protein